MENHQVEPNMPTSHITQETLTIAGRKCQLFSVGVTPEAILIQPTGRIETPDLEGEVRQIAAIKDIPFVLAAFEIRDWDRELTPWPDPAVSTDPLTGHLAIDTLSYVSEDLLPCLDERFGHLPHILGGYSLGGLFSLWSACNTKLFTAVAACSPSVWIRDWNIYASSHPIQAGFVYLSLGDREEYTRDKAISRVGDCIRQYYASLEHSSEVTATTLVWHKGGHFDNPAGRTALGFAWALGRLNSHENE